MANRFFNQFRLSLEKQVVDLWASVAIGGTGAPTLTTAASKGTQSIARVSAGLYDLTLQDSYVGLLMLSVTFLAASGVPAAPIVNVVSTTTASGRTVIRFQCSDVETPAATDPANGETMLIQVTLKNSTAY